MRSNKYFYIAVLVGGLLVIGLILLVTRSKKDDYLVRGRQSYEKHCANCHGNNGEGLQLLIPPLTDPAWLENDSVVCIIKYGMEGSIMVNGHHYNSRMTGNPKIEDDEIADLVSYIRHHFVHKPRRLTVKEVSAQILNCR